MLSDEELLRYSRQILMPRFDIAGQQKLKAAHALVIGAGGLGCPVALYLGAAGVGHLTLVDDDQIELANLQRQIAFQQSWLGDSKAERLAERVVLEHHVGPAHAQRVVEQGGDRDRPVGRLGGGVEGDPRDLTGGQLDDLVADADAVALAGVVEQLAAELAPVAQANGHVVGVVLGRAGDRHGEHQRQRQ